MSHADGGANRMVLADHSKVASSGGRAYRASGSGQTSASSENPALVAIGLA